MMHLNRQTVNLFDQEEKLAKSKHIFPLANTVGDENVSALVVM